MIRYSAASRVMICLIGLCLCSTTVATAIAAEIGSRVKDFQLNDSSGQSHSLQDYSQKVVVLAFWSFKCPVALTYGERINALKDQYGAHGVIVLGVASDAGESAAAIQRNASNVNLQFPILLDPDGVVADELAATRTPSIYVIDGAGILRYRGAFDNNKKPGDRGRISYAEDAVQQVLSGRQVMVPKTSASGCSIRRRVF